MCFCLQERSLVLHHLLHPRDLVETLLCINNLLVREAVNCEKKIFCETILEYFAPTLEFYVNRAEILGQI